MFTVGGVEMYLYTNIIGPQISGHGETGSNGKVMLHYRSIVQTNPLFIEDLLLLENRDRAYSPDIYQHAHGLHINRILTLI
jgi:hypothetical protein